MSDENAVNETTATENPNQNAQQALDDLTVLSNVGDQSMGEARLNAVRATDLSEGALGTLATIHQGSSGAPVVQQGFAAQTGDILSTEITVESAEAAPIAPDVASAPIAALAAETEAAPDTAPRLAGQNDLYGGNVLFGDSIAPETVTETATAAAAADTVQAQTIETASVPAAPEAPLFIDQMPVFGGVNLITQDGTPNAGGPYALSGTEGHKVAFAINAYDPDGGELSYSFTGAEHGTIARDPITGQWAYTPNPDQMDWFGTETIVVSVRDDEGNTVSQTITITMANEDDAAVATVTGGTGSESITADATVVTGSISATDIDGAIVGYEVVNDGQSHHGTLSVDGNGNFVFTAEDGNWNGSDTFTVRVTDSLGGTTDITVPVTVTATDDAAEVTVTGGTGDESTTADATQVSGTITATDVDGAIVGYEVVNDGQAHHGTLSVDANGNFVFTAEDGNWNGSDSFTVRITDANGGTTDVTVPVNVAATEDEAVVTVTGGTGAESTTTDATVVTGSISATDADGAIVGYEVVDDGQTHHGTLSVDANGNFVFTAEDGNWNGSDSFTIRVTDANGGTTDVTVPVSVTATDDAAVVTSPDHVDITVGQDGSGHGGMTATDPDGDTLTYGIVDPNTGKLVSSLETTYGTVTIDQSTGQYTFTPNDNAKTLDDGDVGHDSFQVAVTDGHTVSTPQNVDVTVDGANDAPVVGNYTLGLTTDEDGKASGTIAATDVDAHDTVSYTLVGPNGEHVTSLTTEYGTVEIDPATGTYTFTPKDNLQGLDDGESVADGFKVAAFDGTAYTDPQNVFVTVTGSNDAPVVTTVDSTLTASEDGTASGSVAATDVEAGDTVTYTLVGPNGEHVTSLTTEYGTVEIDPATGDYTFTPKAGLQGLDDGESVSDGFKVAAFDGTDYSDPQSVSVTISGSNDAPVVSVSDLSTGEDASVSGTATATDVDSEASSFYLLDASGNRVTSLETDHGTVTIDSATGRYTFTPNDNADALKAGESAHDSFQVVAYDGTAQSTPQAVDVSITGSNDAPVVQVSNVTTGEDSPVTGQVAATDAEGDSLSYSFGTDASGQPITTLDTANGSVTINPATGEYTFTPNDHADTLKAGQTATDTFTVQVSDGTTTTSADVNVTLTGSNDGPVVEVSNVTTGEDSPVTGHVVASDVDGDSLSYSFGTDASGQPITTLDTANGSVTINPATGEYTFTPNDHADTLKAGQTATDTFTVQVSDGTTTTSADVNVTLTGSNDGPVVEVSNVTTGEDSPVTGHVVASDVDGDSLSYSFGTDASGQPITTLDTANGSVTINPATGEYTFTPNDHADTLKAGQTATDTFTVQVSDGTTTTSADVNVTLTGSNDGPVVEVSNVTTGEDSPVTGHVVASDVDGDSLSYSFGTDASGQPITTLDTANGSVTINPATGEYTFTPNDHADTLKAGQTATDTFTVQVSDGTTTTSADVNVTLTGSNDGPVVEVSNVTTGEDSPVTGHVVASDVDGDSLSYSFGTDASGQPITTLDTTNGSVTINPATGEYTFTPNDHADRLDAGQSATDSFTVQVSDGTTTTSQSVNVTINGSDDATVVTGTVDLGSMKEDSGSVTFTQAQLLGNATDVDDSLHVANVSADGGTLVDNGNGTWTFTPDKDFSGTISVSYDVVTDDGDVTRDHASLAVEGVADGAAITAADVVIDRALGANDVLTGTSGADTMIGGGGNDTLSGGAGDDLIYGDASGTDTGSYTTALSIDVTKLDSSESLSSVTLTGLPATATLSAGVQNADGSWTVPVNQLGGLKLSVDNPTGSGFDITVAVTTTDGTSTALSTDTLHVSYTGTAAGDDVLLGGAGNDTIYGGAGNDTLTGGAGADLLDGGAGNDTFILTGEDGAWSSGYAAENVGDVATDGTNEQVSITGDKVNADVIRGGEGTDTLVGSSGNDAIFLDDGFSPSATGGARLDSVEVINAGDGNDVVDLTSDRYTYGDVTIDGGAGNDVVWGNAGNDLLIGGSGDDNLYGSGGSDTLLGGTGNDTLNGGAGSDTLDAGDGNDLVVAKGSEMAGDVMHGGAGTDTLSIQLTASEYTAAVRAELVAFKQFIAEHPGETFTFTTLGGATADGFEAIKVSVGGTEISLNSPPSVEAVTATVAESTTGAATTVSGSIHAADVDGDALTYSVVSDNVTHNGTLSVDANGNFTFTAKDANWNGTDTFTVKVSDGQGGVTTQTVTVNVTPTNDAPVITAVTGGSGAESTTNAATQVSGKITATDVDGDTLSYSVVNDGTSHHGTLSVDANGNYVFTAADSNWNGSDSFTVRVSDGHGGTVDQKVNITVTPTNDGPDAVADSLTVTATAGADTKAQAPSLSVDISDAVVTTSTSTSTSTTTDSSRDANAVNTGMATPSDWSGLGTLSGTSTSASTVSGTSGNDAYSSTTWGANISTGAGNDTVNVVYGNTGSIDTGSGDDQVKAAYSVNNVSLGDGNDKLDVGTEISGDLDTGSGNDQVKVGTNVNEDVNLGDGDDYIKIGGYLNGSGDTFDAGSGDDVVKVAYNAQSSDMRLGDGNDYLSVGQEFQGKLDAGSGNDTVIIGANTIGTIDMGTGNDYLKIGGTTLNGGTVLAGEGDDTVVFGQSGAWSGSGKIDMGAGNDSLTVNGYVQNTLVGGDGQDTLVLNQYSVADWNNNLYGIRDHVSGFEKVVLTDGVVGSVTETTTTTTTTSTYTYTVKIDAGLTDTDGSESLSSATLTSIPAGASVSVGGQVLTANADGSYTVPLNSSGDATVTVSANQALDLSGVKTSVTSTEANGGATATTIVTGEAVAAGDTAAAETNAPVTIKAADLLANDTDVDGDSLTITGVGNASHGTVSLDANGNVVFTPEDGFTGTATFQYTVSDGHGGTDTATVTVTVEAANDAPVVSVVNGGTGAESTTSAATVVTGSIAASDADGDALTYSVVNDGTSHNGSLSIDANGNFTFTAKDASWDGSDTFTVRVSDGHGGTVDVPVTITVTPMADTPVVSVTAGALQETVISLTNLGGSAGYDNTYGYYILDDNGNPTTGQILFDDANATVNQTATIAGVDPSRIGYFIIPNGDDKNSGLSAGDSVTFSKDASGNWRVVDADGHALSGEGTNVLFSNSALNTDKLAHMVDNSTSGNQNWEDISGGGDRDFNDVNIQTTTSTTTSATSAYDYDASGSSSSSTVTASSWGGKTYGGAGNDTLNSNGGIDTLYGGSGNDTIHAASYDTAFGGSGNDVIDASGSGGSVLVGNIGNDTITGGSGNDVIYGDDFTESASTDGGYAYAALSISGSTSDSAETLTYVVGGLPDGVTLVDANGNALAANADGTYSLTVSQLSGLELKVPTDGSVTSVDLTVTATSHEGTTTASASTSAHIDLGALVGDGADTLSGGAGSDTLYGGGGNDTFVYSADKVNGWLDADYQDQGGAAQDGTGLTVDANGYNATNDTYFGGSGHDTLTMGSGNDAIHISNLSSVEVINAGAGNDIVDLNYSDGTSYGDVTVDGGSGDDYIFANDGNDTLLGGTGNDYISGDAGNDKIYGGDGNDTLYGGSGDDLLNGGAGADKIYGGSGTDTVDYSDSSSGVNVYLGAGDGNAYSGAGGTGTGGDAQGDTYNSIENVNGSAHDDYVYGAAGGSVVNLGDGNDTFDNSEASNVVGKDTVDGGAGNDLIYTGNGDDLLKGGSGNDTLYGEAGNDTLIGGTGNDTLIGGDGSDTFLFDFGDGHDTVTGGTGSNWTDTLDLTSLGAGVTIDITTSSGNSWTVTTDNTDHLTNLGADKDGTVVIHHADGSSDQVDFHSLEQIKW